MPTGRTPLTSVFLALAALVCTTTAAGGVPDRFVFPVVGKVTYTDDYGDPRWGGQHEGNDLMGKRWQYAVAAEPGRVEKQGVGTTYSCWVILRGRSGTEYWYIHLNNDKPGAPENDNAGGCRGGIAWPKGLRQGERVRAGAVIGYVGDSGDANGIQPHLHFEVHPNGGSPVNPYPHLKDARRLIYSAPESVESVWLRVKGVVNRLHERLSIRTALVWSSAGRYFRVSKRVAFDVPSDVVVEAKSPSGSVRGASLAAALPGDRVSVWTKADAPTLATKRGLPGAWDARRVRIRD